MKGTASTTIAGCFALTAFAVAILAGVASGNPAESVLFRAVMALVICYPVGLGVGIVAQHVIRQHIEAHSEANPPPDSSDDAVDSEDAPAVEIDTSGDEEIYVV